MKLIHVDPNKIKIPDLRVTARFDPEVEEQFKASMRTMGAVAPVLCCQVGDDIVLVDGLHRLRESIANGKKLIDVAVVDGDMVDVLTKNIFVDHLRGKTPPSEMVKVVGALYKDYGLNDEQIAAKTGLSRDYVDKMMAVSQLTPYCLEALDQGRINIGQAQALTRLTDPVRQETVLSQLLLYGWTTKALNEFITEVLSIMANAPPPPAAGAPRPPPAIQCFYCRQAVDLTEIANPNTCRECSGIMIASMVQARQQIAEEQPPHDKPVGDLKN